ncbi:hypothetical protein [Kaistia terrae]|uniref:Ion channel n=1 Tax=Kaistia terrae TaxID=537017 RepID=A0ABW0Q100_9HYPH|nr:hypothetical protein [Kaistia terrae]MCX5579916.1 hypothetical protein [Kaistia terrae]
MNLTTTTWESDWIWSVPLIVFTVTFHVIALSLIYHGVVRAIGNGPYGGRLWLRFLIIMGTVAWVVTAHALQATAWAVAYRALGAVPGDKSAMLYSLSALTSYGHAEVYLAPQWQLMGALEALNGIILFGLTIAFLSAIIQKVWSGQI